MNTRPSALFVLLFAWWVGAVAGDSNPCPTWQYPIDRDNTWWLAYSDGELSKDHFRWPSADLTAPPQLADGWRMLMEVTAPAQRVDTRVFRVKGYGYTPYPNGGCAVYGPQLEWLSADTIRANIEAAGVAATEACAETITVPPFIRIGSGARLCALAPQATPTGDATIDAIAGWCDAWRRRCAWPNLKAGLRLLGQLDAIRGTAPNPNTLPNLEPWILIAVDPQ